MIGPKKPVRLQRYRLQGLEETIQTLQVVLMPAGPGIGGLYFTQE